MKITEQARETDIYGKYDTVVAGGGIAGIAAALAAARGGAKVLLLEKEYILGGLATAGLVTIYLPLCDGKGEQLSFGLAEELLKLSISNGWEDRYPKAWLEGGTIESKASQRYEVRFNASMFAILAEKELIKAGVEILYGSYAVACQTQDMRITHLIIENKTGRLAVETGNVIDCTGDADICKFSGESTEKHQKGNILAAWYYYFDGNKYDLMMHGFCDNPEGNVELLESRRYGGLDGRELSEMTEASHEAIYKKFTKDGGINDNHMLANIATVPQIRMTRRLDGVYTMDDTESFKSFSDSVGMFGDWRKAGPHYELPFSVLHGKKIKNLAVAGRCISVTDAMWDITRVIPVCAVSGEAVGTAAAMFKDFDGIDIEKLQKKLTANGVRLH